MRTHLYFATLEPWSPRLREELADSVRLRLPALRDQRRLLRDKAILYLLEGPSTTHCFVRSLDQFALVAISDQQAFLPRSSYELPRFFS